MDHYAGIDVSLECASVCVVDASGKIVREGKVLGIDHTRPVTEGWALRALEPVRVGKIARSSAHAIAHQQAIFPTLQTGKQ